MEPKRKLHNLLLSCKIKLQHVSENVNTMKVKMFEVILIYIISYVLYSKKVLPATKRQDVFSSITHTCKLVYLPALFMAKINFFALHSLIICLCDLICKETSAMYICHMDGKEPQGKFELSSTMHLPCL